MTRPDSSVTLVGLAIALCAAAAPLAQKVAPHVTIRISSRLGVDSDLEAGQVKIGEQLLDDVLAGYSFRLPLDLSNGVYLSVPPWDLPSLRW